MNIRPFYSGSKIISGRGALDTLSFELTGVNARKPLLIAAENERAAEKAVIRALKATVTVIGGICRCRNGEENPAKTIVRTFDSLGCDSLLAIGNADLINAVKTARAELSFGRPPAETDFTRPLAPRRAVAFVTVAVLTPEPGALPDELILDSGARIPSPAFYPDAVFIDPRVTGKSAAVSRRGETAAAALFSAVFALSDAQSHPAARACARAALQQISEAAGTRSLSEQTRLIADARFLSKTALTGSRFVPEIAAAPFLDGGKNPAETLKMLFECALPALSFAKDDLIHSLMNLVPNENAIDGDGQTLRREFEAAVLRLTERLLPESGNKKLTRSGLSEAAEAVRRSALNKEQKDGCLRMLQNLMEAAE